MPPVATPDVEKATIRLWLVWPIVAGSLGVQAALWNVHNSDLKAAIVQMRAERQEALARYWSREDQLTYMRDESGKRVREYYELRRLLDEVREELRRRR